MIEQLETYYATLCEANKLLCAPGKKNFVGYGSEEATPEKSSKLATLYVVHADFSSVISNDRTRYSSTLHVLQHVGTAGLLEEKIREARKKTLTVMRQLIGRILEDNDTGVNCELYTDIVEDISVNPVSNVDINSFGWQATITYVAYDNGYSVTHWKTLP